MFPVMSPQIGYYLLKKDVYEFLFISIHLSKEKSAKSSNHFVFFQGLKRM